MGDFDQMGRTRSDNRATIRDLWLDGHTCVARDQHGMAQTLEIETQSCGFPSVHYSVHRIDRYPD